MPRFQSHTPPTPYSFLAQCFHTYRHTNGWFTGCTEAPVGREIRWVGLALVQTDCADGEKRVTPETQTMEEHRGKEALRFCRRNTMMRSRPVPSWLCATRMKSTHQPGAVALAIACHLALAPSEMHGYWRLAWTGRGSGPDELLPFYAHPGRIYTNSLQFHLRNYRQLVLELAQPQRVTPPAGKTVSGPAPPVVSLLTAAQSSRKSLVKHISLTFRKTMFYDTIVLLISGLDLANRYQVPGPGYHP